MDKENLDLWNYEKLDIENNSKPKRTKIGEIWICNLGMNIGSEISKEKTFQRPVLICSRRMPTDLVFVLPITTKCKLKFSDCFIEIENFYKFGLDKVSFLALNQGRVISTKRLTKCLNGHSLKIVSDSFIEQSLNKMLLLFKKSTLRK